MSLFCYLYETADPLSDPLRDRFNEGTKSQYAASKVLRIILLSADIGTTKMTDRTDTYYIMKAQRERNTTPPQN